MNENERSLSCWSLAEKLYTRYISAHGLDTKDIWSYTGEWERGYWFSVAEFILFDLGLK